MLFVVVGVWWGGWADFWCVDCFVTPVTKVAVCYNTSVSESLREDAPSNVRRPGGAGQKRVEKPAPLHRGWRKKIVASRLLGG